MTRDAQGSIGLFVGVPVRDFQQAVAWYSLVLGADPSSFPHDTEALWELEANRYLYVVEKPDRAGGALVMIWVEDPQAEVERISGQGVEPADVERYGAVRKYVYRDADGNELSIGGEVSEP